MKWKHPWPAAPEHTVIIAGDPERAKKIPRRAGEIIAKDRLGVRNVALRPELGLTTTTTPCKEKRRGCPLQLIFKDGQPYLRLCRTRKKPGVVVPVTTPEETFRLSKDLCACWKTNRRSFTKCTAKGAALGRTR
jgi:hypothetical protein